MVTKGIPAVVYRSANDAGAQGVKIYVGQTIYKGLFFINDDTFEAVAPKITLADIYNLANFHIAFRSLNFHDILIKLPMSCHKRARD